jgi:hypothetical protein
MAKSCEHCRFRAYAERKPRSIIGRLWWWHTRWCPGWRAYQQSLNESSGEKNATPTGEDA